jgi:hypothetical protein
MAQGMNNLSHNKKRAIILSLLFGGGALYLFVDWLRVSRLFLP